MQSDAHVEGIALIKCTQCRFQMIFCYLGNILYVKVGSSLKTWAWSMQLDSNQKGQDIQLLCRGTQKTESTVVPLYESTWNSHLNYYFIFTLLHLKNLEDLEKFLEKTRKHWWWQQLIMKKGELDNYCILKRVNEEAWKTTKQIEEGKLACLFIFFYIRSKGYSMKLLADIR